MSRWGVSIVKKFRIREKIETFGLDHSYFWGRRALSIEALRSVTMSGRYFRVMFDVSYEGERSQKLIDVVPANELAADHQILADEPTGVDFIVHKGVHKGSIRND